MRSLTIDYIYASTSELGPRSNNEDYACITETTDGTLFIVCDGMGGAAAGEVASKMATQTIIEYFNSGVVHNNIPHALNEAMQNANSVILQHVKENPTCKGMGTTCTVLLVQNEKAWIAHAGDSRIYIYLGMERQLHRLTKDHSYVQTLIDAGQLDERMAESHPEKNRILKALGVVPNMKPTVPNQPIYPKSGDFFLLCSDGLSGVLSDMQMEGILTKDTSCEQKANELLALAMQTGLQDNTTFILVEIQNSPHQQSSFVSHNPGTRQNAIAAGYGAANGSRKDSSNVLKYVLVSLTAMLLLGGVAGLFLFLKTAGLSKEAKQRQVQLDKEIKQLNDSIENCDNKIKDLKKDTTDIGDDLKELENDSEYKLKADLLKAAKEVEEDFRKKGKVLRYDSKGRPHYLDIPDEKKNERLEKETSKYETDKIDPKRKELEQKKSELENCSKRKEYFVYQKDSLEKQLQLITRPQKNETKAGNVASPYSEQY